MSNRNLLVAAALGALALVACQPAAPPPPDTAADEAAIRASAPAWADAFNAMDADKLAGMYWEDSLLMPPNHPAVPGGAALLEYFTVETKGLKDAGMTMNIPEAGRIDVSGHLAYEAGNYTVTDAAGATVDAGKYIGVFEKRDGQWRYIRDTWNSDLPPPPPAPEGDAPPAE